MLGTILRGRASQAFRFIVCELPVRLPCARLGPEADGNDVGIGTALSLFQLAAVHSSSCLVEAMERQQPALSSCSQRQGLSCAVRLRGKLARQTPPPRFLCLQAGDVLRYAHASSRVVVATKLSPVCRAAGVEQLRALAGQLRGQHGPRGLAVGRASFKLGQRSCAAEPPARSGLAPQAGLPVAAHPLGLRLPVDAAGKHATCLLPHTLQLAV